jgi:multidrug efflux pump subunit AcrB
VLTTIPFAFIGVFPGLALVGQPLSFPGIIGVVALVGIVVNNAIILIDRTNRARRSGEQIFEAVLHATTSRLEPILLTTITTVVGMLPITLSNPLWGPLGYAIIFGLSFSTILTLLVIPILYLKFAEKTLR